MTTFVNIIIYIVIFYFGFRLFIRLFGPSIFRWVIHQVSKKIERDFIRQQNQFHSDLDPNVAQELHISKDAKISVMKTEKSDPIKNATITDVDFEEIR